MTQRGNGYCTLCNQDVPLMGFRDHFRQEHPHVKLPEPIPQKQRPLRIDGRMVP